MIDRDTLTGELQRHVTALVDDLRHRADTVDQVAVVIEREWKDAQAAGRTAFDLPVWREGLLTQVAVAWVLATVFVRFCEDNGLLPEPVLSGPGERLRRAETAQRMWYREHPADGERAYVRSVIEEATKLPGLAHVFDDHNPVWLFGPSDDAMRGLLDYWREIDPATGTLRRDFTDPAWDTRFLGDLYQDLSEDAKAQYALLQTPEFVEEFILDRTLEPALDEFGLADFRMIDPACGSGHFLLGSFDRLLARWRERAPQEGDRALAERALHSIHGVDLNPFAAAIARFRLLVAALRAAGVRTLAEAPNFTINIAVGDSLLHGPPPGQQAFSEIDEADPATRHLYATEDRQIIHRMLEARYHAVVANPPYITPKDPAANAAYRRRYKRSCHMKYAMAVPFMERLFDLAVRGAVGEPAGFVGQITANSFMKREFGKKVIEEYLKNEIDLTHVVDTSGAYIPGHGTPTVVLFGRNRQPVGNTVRTVLGIRGEPSRPADPAKGQVWTSIVSQIDRPGAEDDYASVSDLDRERLAKHPWSLQGGGATELKDLIEATARLQVSKRATAIGVTGISGEDDAMLATRRVFERRRAEPSLYRRLVQGEEIRDWQLEPGYDTYFPYRTSELVDLTDLGAFHRVLWLSRTILGNRRTFAKKSYFEEDRPWWEWHQVALDRLRSPLSIAFAFVATHNHFVLDRGGKVFNRSAPVIKLPEGTSEDDHLELLGLLNSAVACFWMKQVFHDKGVGGIGGGIGDEAWEPRYEFDGTKLRQFPIPEGSALAWAKRLDALASDLLDNHPNAVASSGPLTREALNEARKNTEAIRRRMVAQQEELDWRCLYLYGITDEDLSMDSDAVPPIDKGQRVFEIVLARKMAAGEAQTTWFERHGSTPITEIPGHWPHHYRQLVEKRIELIESDHFVGLVERPEYKRRWNWDDWNDLQTEALRTWLLDRLEEPRYWPEPRPRSAAQLADVARTDPDFVRVAELYAGHIDIDLTDLVADLVTEESVPYLAGYRYTTSGLRHRQQWERTWDLQRREDAGEDVGTIPVPPKYTKGDFATDAAWRLRGKLDVPKERFIAYPDAGKDTDPTPLVGWAGWDHLQAAQALAALYEERRTVDGWDPERLAPLLAGVAELVPWLRQWHNDPDPATNTRLGDFFADFVTSEAHTLGVSPQDIATWRPQTTRKRQRTARS
jgi:hypothetical protein